MNTVERIVVRLQRMTQLGLSLAELNGPTSTIEDSEARDLADKYIARFGLGAERLSITTERRNFERQLGRRVSASIGGAYVYHPVRKTHLVLINLSRIDRAQPKALEIVVAEEFMHMRAWLYGDRRRHAKHGFDRIAYRVAEVTGASIEEVRSCLLPVKRRAPKYLYRCPGCSRTVPRGRKGIWSCGRCSPTFDHRFVLVLESELPGSSEPGPA